MKGKNKTNKYIFPYIRTLYKTRERTYKNANGSGSLYKRLRPGTPSVYIKGERALQSFNWEQVRSVGSLEPSLNSSNGRALNWSFSGEGSIPSLGKLKRMKQGTLWGSRNFAGESSLMAELQSVALFVGVRFFPFTLLIYKRDPKRLGSPSIYKHIKEESNNINKMSIPNSRL